MAVRHNRGDEQLTNATIIHDPTETLHHRRMKEAKVGSVAHVREVCRRLTNTPSCALLVLLFLLVMVGLNTFLIVWTFTAPHGYPKDPWFLPLEIFITVMIVLEVFGKMFILSPKVWAEHWANLFDILVMTLSVAAVLMYELGPSTAEEASNVTGVAIRVTRDAARSLRLIYFAKLLSVSLVDLSKGRGLGYAEEGEEHKDEEGQQSPAEMRSPRPSQDLLLTGSPYYIEVSDDEADDHKDFVPDPG